MPAWFAKTLCGFRDGRPNTSDKNDKLSIEIGHALFAQLGVAVHAAALADVGNAMSEAIRQDIGARRSDLDTRRDRSAYEFQQYQHLGAVAALRKRHDQRLGDQLRALVVLIGDECSKGRIKSGVHRLLEKRLELAIESADQADDDLEAFVEQLGTESLLKVDVTVSRPASSGHLPILSIGLSGKWSLRTDRAQDCVSQGAKLVGLRRGRMPHFALVTMEPRPAMLALVADGSGSVDCVYHLALPQLVEALTAIAASKPTGWRPLQTLNRLIRQNRLRDYDDLLAVVDEIP
jgi:hypothetical protein